MIPFYFVRNFAVVVLVAGSTTIAQAGHSRFPYVDGGRSPDGRYEVTAELIETSPAGKAKSGDYRWQFNWKDRETGKTHVGQLVGLRSGRSAVVDPVHAHIFVPPGGETFAVWNPQLLARTAPEQTKSPKDLVEPSARAFDGFSHRLTVYRKTGQVLYRLDLQDLLSPDDWNWLYCYGCQVFWQREYPGLTTRTAPRPGYALFRLSADHSLLETTVGATAEADFHARKRDVTPPPPRVIYLHLIEGRVLNESEAPPAGTCVTPFVGPSASGKERAQQDYRPSLDPLRLPGRFEIDMTTAPNNPIEDGER